MIHVDGRPEPTDTGVRPADFVDLRELHRGGLFGYYDADERRVLLDLPAPDPALSPASAPDDPPDFPA